MIRYTDEQHNILDHITEEDGITLVSAGAGSGKSWLSEKIALALKPTKGLYFAFNKAIVEEGVDRFKNTNVECKTFHALAYRYVKPKKSIADISYTCIKDKISYSDKALVIKSINNFYVSSSTEMYEYMNTVFEKHDKGKLLYDITVNYMEKMIEGKVAPTFDFLLKQFHLLLSKGDITCKYDLVILDEINDTTAVALEIFKLIDAPKKLGLGESNQAIYQFLNLVDGFEELKDAPLFRLTQSFRCSESIAEDIQNFMQKNVSTDFSFIGTDEPVANGKSLYCTMTNALVINEISERLASGKSFTLLRKPADIFACPLALMSAASGKKPYQKKYMFLAEEYKNYQKNPTSEKSYFKYLLKHVDDREITNAIKLLMGFKSKGINLFQLYNQTKEAKEDSRYTISTVFTSKGLEFETVEIANDINNAVNKVLSEGGIQTEEDLVIMRCAYVATSRAGRVLNNARFL